MKHIILATIFLAIIGCTPNKESTKETRYRIAYNVWYDKVADDYEVFTMNEDGTDQRNITNWEGVDWVYYAYADKLYIISDRDTTHRMYFLYETDAYGSYFKKFTEYRLNDSWLSSRNNGTEFIVDPKTPNDSAFYILDNKGQLQSKLYTNLAYFNDPFFSPDGKRVVFRGATKSFKKDNGYIDELYIINVDGSGLRKITSYPESDTTANWYSYHAGPPFWEPKRNVISYLSKQNGISSIFLTDETGKEPVKITPDSIYAAWHAWSPDGEFIVFDGYVRDQFEPGTYDVFKMNFESKQIQKLTSDTTYQQAPVVVEVYD